MEKIEVLESVEFEMEVQCDIYHCKHDCLESDGHCSSNTVQWT